MWRRDFLRAGGALAAASCLPLMQAPLMAEDAAWDELPRILARIQAPVFPAREVDVTRYGAAAGGKLDCGDAIARAIDACNGAGGGRVVIPAGVFLTGPIHLKSNVNLHVSAGATLLFARDPSRYLPVVYTRWEGVECMNYSPFIYADGQENIAITGEGTLDGQADCEHWWPWKGRTQCGWSEGLPNQNKARERLFEMGDKDVPVRERIFGDGGYLRPGRRLFHRGGLCRRNGLRHQLAFTSRGSLPLQCHSESLLTNLPARVPATPPAPKRRPGWCGNS